MFEDIRLLILMLMGLLIITAVMLVVTMGSVIKLMKYKRSATAPTTNRPGTWNEFEQTGLLVMVNTILHYFGWSIILDEDENGNFYRAYPARVKFRGYTDDIIDKSYSNVSKYMEENSSDLVDETSHPLK